MAQIMKDVDNGYRFRSSISANCSFGSHATTFQFKPPAEAPVFRPTEEDFMKGPLEYINKIRPFAEKHGICKIIPPASFQPPFAVDVEQFRFTPRVQRLNELEAQTRVKLNFLEQVIKYWDLQGVLTKDKVRGASLKIPMVEKKLLDLYTLHKVVAEEGGFETCTRARKWSKVAYRMNFNISPQNKGTIASLLRQHYERILYPYDVFLSGATIGPEINLDPNVKPTLANHADIKEAVKIGIKIEPSDDNASSGVPDGSTNGDEPMVFMNSSPEKSSNLSSSAISPSSDSLPCSNSSSDIKLKIENVDEPRKLRSSPRRISAQQQPQQQSRCVRMLPFSVASSNSNSNNYGIMSDDSMTDKFDESQTSCDDDKMCLENGSKTGSENEEEERLEPISLRPSPRRLARRMNSQQQRSGTNFQRVDKELQRLAVYGAGPKMPGFSETRKAVEKSQVKEDLKLCTLCSEDVFQNQLLRCAGCDNSFHLYCLIPPLHDMPKGIWHCPRCVAYFVRSQPHPFTHEFGFVQSQRDYSLTEFGEMADQFKTDYFRMAPHTVPHSHVEKEFWRLVASMDDTVVVEYGADLHTNDFGSGFPTRKSKSILPSDEEYIDHPWNLNNLPILDGSVFKYINSKISGMIVPWIYVGMCFSTFCWHNEDHWSYSINYLHWGEAKTWYGVPGDQAQTFENAMKKTAPELFESQPDLLHQLVTICNPNILMGVGVPIYRTNQLAGEFVVTFPRAYHAGFNQGLNLAEAVNFAPSNWLPIGRVCVDHYSMLQRFPVFSHDELICKMAILADELDVAIASATFNDMLKMVEKEKELRLSLLEWGVSQKEKIDFEILADDERQCDYCKTTCYLSGVSCECHSNKFVCLSHKDKLCRKCPSNAHLLRYRYTLDEFPPMLKPLKHRCDEFESWVKAANSVVNICKNSIGDVDIEEAESLIEIAKKKKFPLNCKVFGHLQSSLDELRQHREKLAKKAALHAINETNGKLKTRFENNGELSNEENVDDGNEIDEKMAWSECGPGDADDSQDSLSLKTKKRKVL